MILVKFQIKLETSMQTKHGINIVSDTITVVFDVHHQTSEHQRLVVGLKLVGV